MMEGASNMPVTLRNMQGESIAEWGVAQESAVEIDINGTPFGVTMATPAELDWLAMGFVCTEGAVTDPCGIRGAEVRQTLEGWIVNLDVAAGAVNGEARRGRMLEGRAGCGLCGVETLTAAMRRSPLARNAVQAHVSDTALRKAFARLDEQQPLNNLTHSVHGAGWCDLQGNIARVCEDVGRHNALDKLAGWYLDAGMPGPGFVVLSSRVSYELVCKAAALGASTLAALSAPTSLALDIARQAGLPLAFPGPDDSIVRFVRE